MIFKFNSKKYYAVLCFFICFCLFLSMLPTAFAVGGRNLIRNPEFDRRTQEWELQLKGDTNGGMKVVRNIGMSGMNAIKVQLTNGGGTFYDAQLYQEFPIIKGKVYSISFMAKAEKPRSAQFVIQQGETPYAVHFKQDINITTEIETFGPYIFDCTMDDPTSFLRFNLGLETMATYFDKIQITEVSADNVTVGTKYNKEMLESYKGVHPRLFVDSKRADELRKAIKPDGTHSHLWKEFQAQADRLIVGNPPIYKYSENMSWQRIVGNDMATLSAAYLLSGEKKYLDGAKKWAAAACSYETWGTKVSDSKDLESGHLFLGLSIVYDWCYKGLDDQVRKEIRKTILSHGEIMYRATGNYWWKDQPLQNHNWVSITGLTLAGLAIFDESKDVLPWFGKTLEMMNTTMSVLGEDGASHEGYPYMEYGVSFLLNYAELARKFFDVDMFKTEWLKNNTNYFIYLGLPKASWNNQNRIVNLADAPRNDWYGPDYSLRKLAKEYQNGYAQWLANQIDTLNLDDPISRWLNLVNYDPNVAETPPNDLPTFHHFNDMDIVSARSDWSGNESLLVFKSGPYMGHTVDEKNNTMLDWGGGHTQPDANHFNLFANGEWMIRDDGYAYKFTGQHNTLLVNGKGQVGEGKLWIDAQALKKTKATAKIIKAESKPDLDYMVGDSAKAYPKEMGLKKFERHLLFLKPDVLIVVDDIETEQPQQLELRFFPEQQTVTRQSDGGYYIPGINSNLRFVPLTTQNVDVKTEMTRVEFYSDSGNPDDKLVIKLQSQQKKWRNVVALSWADGKTIPAQVKMTEKDDQLIFDVENRSVILNMNDQTVLSNKKADGINVKVDGKWLELDVSPTIIGGRTLVPVRKIFEALGAQVDWNEETKIITAVKNDKTVELKIDSTNALVNGNSITLDTPATMIDNRSLVPVRFVSESMGARVKWNERSQIVSIFSEDNQNAQLSNDATLVGLSINGKSIKGFDSNKTAYEMTRTWSSKIVPQIAAMPNDLDADISIKYIQGDNPAINIDVTAPDGKTKNTYVINILPLKGISVIAVMDVWASNDKVQPAINAIDNNLTTFWSAEGEHWIQFDLGKIQKISGIKIAEHLGDKRSAIFDIQVSKDGTVWDTVYSGKSSGTTLEPELYQFNEVETRYVKYVGHGNTSNKFNSVTEIGIQ